MGNDNNKKFSLRTLVATGALVLATASAMAALLGSVYCSKAELAMVKEEVKDDIAAINLKVVDTKWKGEIIAVRVQNIERRQIQMGENLTKLLNRLRVRPVDPPYLTPIPSPPRVLDGIDSSP